jgi:hypothetical protein
LNTISFTFFQNNDGFNAIIHSCKTFERYLNMGGLDSFWNRKGNKERIEAKKRIAELLGQENFQLWNSIMTRTIDFNRIGVLKLGRKWKKALQQKLQCIIFFVILL